jgi:PPOX class probable F420-dependent enzyme
VTPEEARRRFAEARVARLASVDAHGRPHLVPIVFALSDETIYSVIDAKPKRTVALRRLENVSANSLVSVLTDHYEEDWRELWWARADGSARVIELVQPEARRAVELLTARYPQQRAVGPVLAVDVESWRGWSAA